MFNTLIVGLISSALLYGCAEQPVTDEISQNINKGTSIKKPPGTAGSIAVKVNKQNGRLHYVVSTVATDGCHSKGKVTESEVKKNNLTLNAVINYQPGICTQALKTIFFKGTLSEAADNIDTLTVSVFNTKYKTVNEKTIFIGY